MTRSGSETKKRILTTAYGLVYKEGFGRVSVDAIAEAAGITKRTLYYHFDSKDSLVENALDQQHIHALAQIQEWGCNSARTPSELVDSIFKRLADWASKPK